MKKSRSAIVMSVLIGVLLLCLTPAASANESALEFRAMPGPGSDVSEGGDYFVLSMEPGDVESQTVEISNPATEPLTVRLAAVDTATAQMGGVDYGAEQLPTKATGSWIALDQERVDLEPGESQEVAFDVNAPSDAPSGVHLGGLVVWVEGPAQEQTAGGGATMNVQSRRVIAVQVDLPGPALPVVELRGAQAEARPDGLYLGIELFNSGNGFAKGTGMVSIEGRDEEGTFPLDTVVPRTGTVYPFRWAATGVPNGSYGVTVEIDYGSGIATWEGDVVVGAAVQDALRGRGVGPSPGRELERYLVIGGGLGLALLAYLLLRRLRDGRSVRRLPRIAIQRTPRPAPSGSTLRTGHVPVRIGASAPPRAAVYVPSSEDRQRRVPPPPPPPPGGLRPPPPPPPLGAERAA